MLYVICNPAAGSGRGKKIGQAVANALREKNIAFQMHDTKSHGHATALARSFCAQGAQTILAIGGDGTLSEAAQGLTGSGTALGIIPAGTGNDFVKTLHLPKNPMEALDFALSHPARKIDAGVMNGRVFLNAIGTGFDVSVLDYAASVKKYVRGLAPYLYGVLQTIVHYHAIPLTYALDGGTETTASSFVIAIANGSAYGGGIRIAPEAKADDGMLDIVVVSEVKPSAYLSRLTGLLKGKILSFPETLFSRCREITFSAPSMRVNVDGEIISADHVSARILPGAMLIHC